MKIKYVAIMVSRIEMDCLLWMNTIVCCYYGYYKVKYIAIMDC